MKTVIITGAGGNLGTAVTEKFLLLGYRVIATVRNEKAKAELAPHPNLSIKTVDLASETDTAAFVQAAIQEYKQLDAALLLAGGYAAGNISVTTGEHLHRQYALNFETAYYIARPLFQHMMEIGSGRLVLIGGRPALDANAGKDQLAYGLSKSLLFKLAEYLNAEGKERNVTTAVVVPGIIDTPPNRENMPGANTGDWVTPAQLADILAFVTSPEGDALREPILKVYSKA